MKAKGLNKRQSAREVADAFIPTFFSESTPKEIIDETAMAIADFHPSGMLTMLNSFARANLNDVLPEISIPVLLLYGDHDKRSPLEVAMKIYEAIHSSKMVIIPGAGHLIHMEAPEMFNAEVREFLRSVSTLH